MITASKIMNPQALINIFGCIPDFIGSELMDIRIKSFKRTIVIQLMTNYPVQNKPQKWGEYNVVYIDISLFDIRKLFISGDVITNSIIKFDIKEDKEEVFLEIQCNSKLTIKCNFDWARVEQIKPGLISSF